MIIQGDCLEVMKDIEDKSVDMILCDLPYGTTACAWDSVIPLDKLWVQYKRIITDIGCIALFGSEPFSTALRYSNLDMFKYDWIWEKGRASGFVHAKNKPLKCHEIISIFSKGTTVHANQSKNRMNYFPQMEKGDPYIKKITRPNTGKINHVPSKSNTNFVGQTNINSGERYPRSILKFSMHNVGNFHPTQKPLALCEYLIKTYTNEGELVLDNCLGSGTTAVACKKLKRQCIGIEKEEKYIEISKKRLQNEL